MLGIVTAVTVLLLASTGAVAQSYPSKPVKVIVPIAAGSGIDIVARAVCHRLQENLGQPFVIGMTPARSRLTS